MSIIEDKEYMEELARQTLSYIKEYASSELERKDAPDLQDCINNHGIEVVQDVYENEQETIRFIEAISSTPVSQIPENKLKRLKKRAGVSICNDKIQSVSLSKTSAIDTTHLIETIKQKIDKLNAGNYSKVATCSLYVFVDTVFIDEYFSSCVEKTLEEIRLYTKPLMFKMLYLDYYYGICICDIEAGVIKNRVKLDQDARKNIRDAVKIELGMN